MLQNWKELLANINDLCEESCKKLLEQEKKGRKRLSFMLRIYGRMNAQRTKRERNELRKIANEN